MRCEMKSEDGLPGLTFGKRWQYVLCEFELKSEGASAVRGTKSADVVDVAVRSKLPRVDCR